MAVHVYRYRQIFNQARLQKFVPGSPTFVSSSAAFADIQVDSASKADLDDVMTSIGWSFEATDPVATPNAQSGTEIGGATSFNQRRILWRDHLVTGNNDLDELGEMGWRITTVGTGANVALVAGEAGHPGIIRLDSGTSAAARSAMYLGDSTLADTIKVTGTQNQIEFGFLVRPFASVLAVDLERIQVGLGSQWTLDAELLSGVYWRYTALTDTKWTLVCANGGTRTAVASTVSPASGTWVKLGATITYPGGVPTVQGYIDDVAAGSVITTNLPTVAVSPGLMIQGPGAVITEAQIDLDETYGYQDPA